MKSTSVIATTTTLVISALSFLSISGLGQPALGQSDRSGPCARFYAQRNNRGKSFSVCQMRRTLPRGFNDQISSIYIPRGRKCILYADAAFKGRNIEFKGKTGRANLGPKFNDQVSSIQCTIDFDS